MSTTPTRKSSQSVSWQVLVIIGAFSVVVFFSFFAVAYLVPLHPVGSAIVSQTNENIQKSALDSLTGNKPQLRSEDHLEIAKSDAPPVAINAALCKSVEFVVNSTIGVGTISLNVHHDWAPNGAARFCELVDVKYYDDVRFFRVLKVSLMYPNI